MVRQGPVELTTEGKRPISSSSLNREGRNISSSLLVLASVCLDLSKRKNRASIKNAQIVGTPRLDRCDSDFQDAVSESTQSIIAALSHSYF